MKYILMADDMTCVGDLTTCCSDYGIAYYLFIVKKALELIHIVVPMILIIMVTIDFVKMVINPDDSQRKKSKSLYNKFFAAIFIFFIPFVVNLLFNLIDNFGVEISGCWNAAESIVNVMENTEEHHIDTNEKNTIYEDTGKDTASSSNDSNNNKNKNSDSNSSSSSSSTKNTGEKMVKYAKKFVGNPYVYGGTSLTNGTDCSGFTMRIHEHYGITIPRTAADQASSSAGKSISSLSKAKPGDLLFYKGSNGTIGHVTMYMGNNKVIHASNSRTGIIISDVNYRQYSSIKRFW